jgi:hypothetical protein
VLAPVCPFTVVEPVAPTPVFPRTTKSPARPRWIGLDDAGGPGARLDADAGGVVVVGEPGAGPVDAALLVGAPGPDSEVDDAPLAPGTVVVPPVPVEPFGATV